MSYKIALNGRLRFSMGKSFRVPTFTELYYESPANLGNLELQPEEAWSYELGANYKDRIIALAGAMFYRDGTDMIEWARDSIEAPWQVMNIADVETWGGEVEANLNLARIFPGSKLRSLGLFYGYLDSRRTTGQFESKYLIDLVRHQVNGKLQLQWTELVSQNIYIRYSERMHSTGYIVVDSRWTVQHGAYMLFFEASNMFNQSYSEVGSIPAPGRWFRAGISFNLH